MTEQETQTNPDNEKTTPEFTDPDQVTEQKQLEQMTQTLQSQVDRGELTLPDQFQGDVSKFIDSYKHMQQRATKAEQEKRRLEQERTPPAELNEQPQYAESDNTSQTEQTSESQTDWTDLTSNEKEQVQDGDIKNVWPELDKHLKSNGQITEDFANQHNIPNEMIQFLNRAYGVVKDADKKAAADHVGGEQQLNTLLEWAKANLKPDEQKFIQEQLRGPNWSMALDALQARHQRKNKTPSQINNSGSSGPQTTAEPWTSPMEKNAAYRDPRYRSDVKYRNMVYAREAATLQQQRR